MSSAIIARTAPEWLLTDKMRPPTMGHRPPHHNDRERVLWCYGIAVPSSGTGLQKELSPSSHNYCDLPHTRRADERKKKTMHGFSDFA